MIWSGKRLAVLTVGFIATSANAAELTQQVELPGGTPHEQCMHVTAAQTLSWHFTSSAPLAFNVHFHEGAAMHHEVMHTGTQHSGRLVPEHAQVYCVMWSNESGQAVSLRYTLELTSPRE